MPWITYIAQDTISVTIFVVGIKYLTGATGEYLEQGLAHEYGIGLLIQPGNKYHKRVAEYPMWAADNGAFSKKGGFNPQAFRAMLAQPELAANRSTCLFVVAPDVLVVLPDGVVIGDARATLEQFPQWAHEIRAMGLPVAFVAQNGLEGMLDEVPWHLVDVLFVGGSTEWKLSESARLCVARAQLEGKRTHMGRVNSYKRLKLADGWGVDTADGTFLAYGPTQNVPRLIAWLEKLRGTTPQGANDASIPVWTDQHVLGRGSEELASGGNGVAAPTQDLSARPDASRLPRSGGEQQWCDRDGGSERHTSMPGGPSVCRAPELGHSNRDPLRLCGTGLTRCWNLFVGKPKPLAGVALRAHGDERSCRV